MLSRARTPRICLACQYTLNQQRALIRQRPSPSILYTLTQYRQGSSDTRIQSKERVEGLISGRLVETPEPAHPKKRRVGRPRKNTRNDEPERQEERTLGPSKGSTRTPKSRNTRTRNIPNAANNYSAGRREVHAPTPAPMEVEPQEIDTSPASSAPVEVARKKSAMEERMDSAAREFEQDKSRSPFQTSLYDRSTAEAGSIASPLASAEQKLLGSVEDADMATDEVDVDAGLLAVTQRWAEEARLTEEAEPSELKNQGGEYDATSLSQNDQPITKTSPLPPTRRNRVKHPALQQRRVSVDALGQRIDAIVLKDPDTFGRKDQVNPVIIPRSEVSKGDEKWKSLIADMKLDSKFQDQSIDDLAVAVESMRPQDTRVISRSDFRTRENSLVNDFTAMQLQDYVCANIALEKENAAAIPEYPWLLSQESWAPIETSSFHYLTPKRKMARSIMRTLWGVEILEEIEGLGKAMLSLRSDVFDLITHPSGINLQRLSHGIIDTARGEKINPINDNKALQIMTSKSGLTTIMSRLDEMVQVIVSKTVSVASIDPQNLLPEVLAELARVTDTSITYIPKDKSLKVSWINEYQLDKTIVQSDPPSFRTQEEPSDTVLRLLEPRPSQIFQGEQQVVSGGQTEGSYIPYRRENRSMSWRDKLRQWSRYTAPIQKPTEGAREINLELSRHILIPSPDQPNVELGARHMLTATFGHILHQPVSSAPTKNRKSKPPHRIISPLVPHPAAFTEFKAPSGQWLEIETFVMLHLVPDHKYSAAPEVHVKLPVAENDSFSNLTMIDRCEVLPIRPWYQHDILLPTENTDVRLTQQRILAACPTEETDLHRFFLESDLDLNKGRLITPKHVDLSLPPSLLGKKSKKHVVVPYVFAGFEVHRVVNIPFHNHLLRYRTIEGGQHSGTRTELSLQAVSLPIEGEYGITKEDQTRITDTNERAEFMKLVEKVVQGKFFSWTTGASEIKDIPPELYEEEEEYEYTEEDCDAAVEGAANGAAEQDNDAVNNKKLDEKSNKEEKVEKNEPVLGEDITNVREEDLADVNALLTKDDIIELRLRDKKIDIEDLGLDRFDSDGMPSDQLSSRPDIDSIPNKADYYIRPTRTTSASPATIEDNESSETSETTATETTDDVAAEESLSTATKSGESAQDSATGEDDKLASTLEKEEDPTSKVEEENPTLTVEEKKLISTEEEKSVETTVEERQSQ